jgi:hypothetical protein
MVFRPEAAAKGEKRFVIQRWMADCPKIVTDLSCYSLGAADTGSRLFDRLLLSRYGESSSEPGSVMILNPMTGNSLEKEMSRHSITSHEQ